MGHIHLSASILVLGVSSFVSSPAALGVAPVDSAPNPAAVKKFDQAVDRTENLLLPINKVVLYREAATALIPTDRPRAVMLLKRALSDIDAAEAGMKTRTALDDTTWQQLEFHRLPVIMLMERIDPVEACNVLALPQTADNDMTFQTLFFERLKNPEIVRQVALRKLTLGVTPAVIAAYGVLKTSSPDVAKSLGAAIVLKLAKTDAENDPEAVHSAFLLTHLLRTDIGALAPEMILNPDLLPPDALRDLFSFIGDAFLASKDPEELILGLRPQLYISALETYAPDKAQDVKLLAFAMPDAKSKILSTEAPVFDANHPDPATLTPEQIARRAAMRVQVEAQIKDSNDQIAALTAKANQEMLPQKERDAAVFHAVDQANRAISLARAYATVLNREAFRDGEVEFYNLGEVTGLIDHVSALLQTYALKNPSVAENAALNLDGHEVQTQVALGVAIREMTGSQPYLVPAEKPPVGKGNDKGKIAPAPAVDGQTGGKPAH
jgi:hypothetical protein